MFLFLFLYAVTMFIYQIKRIISSEKWLNYFFFLKIPKIWVGRATLNGEKNAGMVLQTNVQKILKSGSRCFSACNALNFFSVEFLGVKLQFTIYIYFSEQPFYGNYSALDYHTNTAGNFSRLRTRQDGVENRDNVY